MARKIGLDDPSKIRLTPHNCYSQQPKPQPIKYRGVEHLSDMLVHYNQVTDSSSFWYSYFVCTNTHFDYKVLDIPLPMLFLFCVTDLWHFVLRSFRYSSSWIARFEKSESCIPSCYQGWGMCMSNWCLSSLLFCL